MTFKMTPEIIEMAQEIAAQYSKSERYQTWTHDFMMQRLMHLVTVSAAAEREEFAVHAVDIARRAIAKEREACAKVCEAQEDDGGEWDIQQQCANTIRARGEPTSRGEA
jgi:hypothetical protein